LASDFPYCDVESLWAIYISGYILNLNYPIEQLYLMNIFELIRWDQCPL